jgi:hypothetical protein
LREPAEEKEAHARDGEELGEPDGGALRRGGVEKRGVLWLEDAPPVVDRAVAERRLLEVTPGAEVLGRVDREAEKERERKCRLSRGAPGARPEDEKRDAEMDAGTSRRSGPPAPPSLEKSQAA